VVDRALRFDLLGRDRTLGRTLGQAEGRMQRFGKTMGRVAVVGGAALAGLGAAAGVMGIKTLAGLESAEIGFTQLLGSGQRARRFIADLKQFAKATPFELPGLIESARGLLGAGKAAKDVIPSLRAYGDATGALGLNQEQFGRIMRAVTQIMNKGKVQAEELLQISEAGIPIYPLLAKAMGKTIPELQSMMMKGELLAKDVLPKLEAQMAKDYGGSMAKQSKTLTGLWSTLMDTINIGLADVLRPFQSEIKSGLSAAISGLGGAFEVVATGLQSVFGPGGAFDEIDLSEARRKIEGFTEPIVATVKGWGKAAVGGFQKGLEEGDWSQLGGILGKALSRIIGNGADLLKTAFGGVNWVEVGKTIGSQAFGFAVGFVSALGSDFIDVARNNPLDLAIFFTSFLAVGKLGGVVARIISKIPILRIFAPLLTKFDALTAPITSKVGALVGKIGSGLFEGLSRVFPRAAKIVQRGLQDMIAWFALRAEAFRDGGSRMIRNLAIGIGEQIGLVAAGIGRTIRAITRPFIGAAGWLIRYGVDAIRGLARGVGSMLGSLATRMRDVRNTVIRPFATAFNWLRSTGGSIISGLVNGLRGALGRVRQFVVDLKDRIIGGIKRLFGIASPSKVMMELGGHIVMGLVRGLVTNRTSLGKILKSMGGDITEAFAGLGGGGSARGLVGFAKMAMGVFRGMFPGMTIGGWRARGSVPGSDHPKGKALDLMTGSGAIASMIISVFRSMMGAKYWIWNRQIASAPGWDPRAYSGPSPHTDHVHLSFFRKGGIATKATPGVFGEAGPEALIPLDKAHRFGLGQGPAVVVNLHFHAPVVGGPGAADHFADLIVDALRRKKRNLGGAALGIA
jgi:tape measure domain-containing protein